MLNVRVISLVIALSFLFTSDAHADGVPLGRRVDWGDWHLDPVILLNVCLVTWLYSRGWVKLHLRRGRRAVGTKFQAAFFGGGIMIVLGALLSPLDPLSGQLAFAHMIQHVLLMAVAAPLLVLSAPWVVCLRGLPPAWRELVGRSRRHRVCQVMGRVKEPGVAWGIHALVLWIWHLPALYGAAVRSTVIHDLQHLFFFVAACFFWRPLLDASTRTPLDTGLSVLYLFTTTLHVTVLGVFMTIAPSPWYPEYIGRSELWGLTPLEDQQLAGLIMWMPACLPYVLAAIVIFARAIEEPRQDRRQIYLKGTTS